MVAVLLACLGGGCATPAKSEFTTFAQAGSGYAAAVDRLLVAAGTAQVDSTSWTLVLEKQSTGMDDATYTRRSSEDLARLEQIARLRKHAQLLGQYFGLLEALATSDTPDRTQTAIDGVATGLSRLKKDLPEVATALPDLGKVALEIKARTALKDELDRRERTIREHLEIQEQLLKELAGEIGHALTLSRNSQEQVLLMDPIVSDKEMRAQETWVSTRRRVMLSSLTAEELTAASLAATKLREAFEGVLSGEVTIGRMNALLADIDRLLYVAKTIQS
jgi:hypothetical protein